MRLGAPVILALLAPTLVLPDEMRVSAPEGAEVPRISIYDPEAALDVPLAQITRDQAADLPDGEYVYGIDSFAWRSARFDHVGETELRLGALSVNAPADASFYFTLHDAAHGALVLPIAENGTVAVPEGLFELRADLAEAGWPVQIEQGETTGFPVGAMKVETPLAMESVIYVAQSTADSIAGILRAETPVLTLPEGRYRYRSGNLAEVHFVDIADGETVEITSRLIRMVSGSGSGGLNLKTGDQVFRVEEGTTANVIVFNDEMIVLESDEGAVSTLPVSPEFWLWQNADGSFAHDVGLPVDLAENQQNIALPGDTVRLVSHMGFEASVDLRVLQGDTELATQTFGLGTGWREFSIAVPERLSPDVPLRVNIATGPKGARLQGQITDIPVHRFLTADLNGLMQASASTTEITLTWSASEEPGVHGYRVFRGNSEYPISGTAPLQDAEFTDIALSAGRAFIYRVCTIDALGLVGRCDEITAQTVDNG